MVFSSDIISEGIRLCSADFFKTDSPLFYGLFYWRRRRYKGNENQCVCPTLRGVFGLRVVYLTPPQLAEIISKKGGSNGGIRGAYIII